jgi:hypothetical protein
VSNAEAGAGQVGASFDLADRMALVATRTPSGSRWRRPGTRPADAGGRERRTEPPATTRTSRRARWRRVRRGGRSQGVAGGQEVTEGRRASSAALAARVAGPAARRACALRQARLGAVRGPASAWWRRSGRTMPLMLPSEASAFNATHRAMDGFGGSFGAGGGWRLVARCPGTSRVAKFGRIPRRRHAHVRVPGGSTRNTRHYLPPATQDEAVPAVVGLDGRAVIPLPMRAIP